MEKRRLFKVLVGLALSSALMQGLQAGQQNPNFQGVGVNIPLAPGQVPEPAQESWYVKRAKAALRSGANMARSGANMATDMAIGHITAPNRLSGRAIATVTSAVGSVGLTPQVKSLGGTLAAYYTAKAVETGLSGTAKWLHGNGHWVIGSAFGLASWLPTVLKYEAMSDFAQNIDQTVPNKGLVKRDTHNPEKIGISTSGLWATAKISALGAAAYIAPSVVRNTFTGADSTAFGDFTKAFVAIGSVYNAYKAYNEFRNKSVVAPETGAKRKPVQQPESKVWSTLGAQHVAAGQPAAIA